MKKNKIGIYGLRGSYTHQAAVNILKEKKINTEQIDFVELPKAPDLLNFLKKGNEIIFPIENSTGGIVTQILDLLPEYEIDILNEYQMQISHCLLAKKNTKKIEKVYSHPQSLLQCSGFIEKNKLEEVADIDNSVAAKNISQMGGKNIGAIGGEILAELYGLKILKKSIQNNKENITRFFVARKKGKKTEISKKIESKEKKKISMIFETKSVPGVLYKSLGSFAIHGLNLTHISSRPLKNGKKFYYFFYVEFEGQLNDKNVKIALEELKCFTERIEVLGNY